MDFICEIICVLCTDEVDVTLGLDLSLLRLLQRPKLSAMMHVVHRGNATLLEELLKQQPDQVSISMLQV